MGCLNFENITALSYNFHISNTLSHLPCKMWVFVFQEKESTQNDDVFTQMLIGACALNSKQTRYLVDDRGFLSSVESVGLITRSYMTGNERQI